MSQSAEEDAPCREESDLLRAFWDLYWNGPGTSDYGDHAGRPWDEEQALDDAASLVEDHHAQHGCRVIPPGSGDPA